MATVKLLGRILPDSYNVTVGYNPRIKWKWEEENLELEFSYSIKDSLVTIECELAHWKPEYLSEIHKRGCDIVHAAINLITFSTGTVLQLHLNRLVRPDGQESLLVIENPHLVGLCTTFSMSQTIENKNCSFDKALSEILVEPGLFLALNDLCLAISHHSHTTVGCARALDGIRTMIWGKPIERKDGDNSWKKLRNALQFTADYLKLITESSKGSRHGSRDFIPGTTTTEVTKRSWIVMNRYMELRARNIAQLPVSEFPLL